MVFVNGVHFTLGDVVKSRDKRERVFKCPRCGKKNIVTDDQRCGYEPSLASAKCACGFRKTVNWKLLPPKART
jgi:transcription elongation factor Elf1